NGLRRPEIETAVMRRQAVEWHAAAVDRGDAVAAVGFRQAHRDMGALRAADEPGGLAGRGDGIHLVYPGPCHVKHDGGMNIGRFATVVIGKLDQPTVVVPSHDVCLAEEAYICAIILRLERRV